MKCPHCQAENTETAIFCVECGQQIQTNVVCSKCQHVNKMTAKFCEECGNPLPEKSVSLTSPERVLQEPTSFLNDRYQVKKKLGEGGKKKVYLVHDTKLNRDVAFALIKTENLDEDGRKRVTREAQAMGKLGDNPNIMSIFEMGEINDQPYIINPVMGGGDVEALIEKVPDHKLPLEQTISIAKAVCQGLIFAHSKGVIHRDLKPGNVWLTDDGTAKIGDFGLAVMSDVSRLTVEGMMVGTVSYMPPEQAMGGKATPKADLYSLGAMLYEMVTGRPPFIGDDSVSIIGQHINVQPISPTWHRADLPPTFESLIMMLLEKDPEKRPGSAKDVLAVLESIEKGDIKESTIETQAPVENPLYRRIFVGRENELKTLQNAFVGAMSGQGGLTMVIGEPGIGKTAICEQLSTFVTLRGGMTLWGHCYEEGSLSLPYLAFVEAIRSYVMDRNVDDLKKELGSGATEVARIVSEVREKLHVEPRETQNPDEDRYRLMQAITSFLINTAAVKPMLIILEDLHDADKGTLEMLSYLSRNLAGTRLLLVGTYRDVEVDRSHPLSSALAELRRVSSFNRVLLRGLNVDEVRRMLAGITHEEIPVGLAGAVHRQTEGNPLFVQEVIRYLNEEKLLHLENGKMTSSNITQLEMNIPEGLRDVIGKRLTNLSDDCNQLLSIASVIGREFTLSILKEVTDIVEDVFVNALKEAVQLSILEERTQVGAIRYRFTHAFFRQTLYEELIAPLRLQMHQRVARAMETVFTGRLEEHAAELAEHFSQSTDPADLEKAVIYSEMAAQKAMDVYAYGEAVRLFEQAIKVQRVLDPKDKEKICDLLLELGNALQLGGEPQRAFTIELDEAFSLAEDISDTDRASQACELAFTSLINHGSGGMDTWGTPVSMQWIERLDRYAKPDSAARIRVNMAKGEVMFLFGHADLNFDMITEGSKLIVENMESALRFKDSEIYWYSIFARLAWVEGLNHVEENLKLAEEFADQPHTGASVMISGFSWLFIGYVFLQSGQILKAKKQFDKLREFVERTGQPNLLLSSMSVDSIIATMEGKLKYAYDLGIRILQQSQELGIPPYGVVWGSRACLASGQYLGGDTIDNAIQISKQITGQKEITDKLSLLMLTLLGYIDQNDEVESALEQWVISRSNIGQDDDEVLLIMDLLLLVASVNVGHRPAAALLLSKFRKSHVIIPSFYWLTCIPRHCGTAAVLLERYGEAREYFVGAINVCTEMQFRPELALSRLQISELLLDHYPNEKAEALEHLDFAIREFREMKMQPSLERALRRKDILKA